MTYTAIIRQRGQLTIPDQLRQASDWLRAGEIVGIEADEDEVRIRPHSQTVKKVDWNSFWKMMELSRSFRGSKNDKPLSQIIIEDRESH